jgi:preprotein translocase SecF subunit
MQFFKTPNIGFVRVRRKAMLISLLCILAGVVSMVAHKGFNASIDFAGGTIVEIRTENELPLHQVREIVAKAGFAANEVTRFGDPKEILIKVKRIGEAANAAEKIQTALKTEAGQNVEIRRMETVGPKIGGELKTAAFWAVIYSLALIIVYVSWRFQFKFAIAAIIALAHDVLITLGFFSLTNREISLPVIAAILTIVGYSLNDTIVVFDRIRENMRFRKRESFDVTVNVSINETLSRTIITSFTTLLVVLSLVIFGGEVIRDFALALLVGISVGTYSSIFVASPIIIEWNASHSKHAKVKPKKK